MSVLYSRREIGQMLPSMQVGVANGCPEQQVWCGLHALSPQTVKPCGHSHFCGQWPTSLHADGQNGTRYGQACTSALVSSTGSCVPPQLTATSESAQISMSRFMSSSS